MKKTFLLCVALMVTAIASAQLKLIKTITTPRELNYAKPGSSMTYPADLYLPPHFVYYPSADGKSWVFYDAETFELYKTVTIPTVAASYSGKLLRNAFKNFWTTDGKMAFVLCSQNNAFFLINEDGEILLSMYHDNKDFEFNNYSIQMTPSGKYVLFCNGYDRRNGTGYLQKIYAIPGDGKSEPIPTEIETSPKYTPRAIRKAIRQGQILVDTPEYEYTITGQKVR